MNTTERNASTTKADSNAKATGDLKEAVRKEYAAQIQAASKAVSSKEATHDQDSDGASDNSVTMLEPLRGDKGHQAALHREALQRIYQKALKHIVEKSKLPLPSCFTSENPDINTKSASLAAQPVSLQGYRMRLRINDYWHDHLSIHGPNDCQTTWTTFQAWASYLGFEVLIDNKGDEQIDCACGMVAARCLSWFKHGRPGDPHNDDFMKMNTNSAVSPRIVNAANAKLLEMRPPPREARRGSVSTWMLWGNEVRKLMDWWNQPLNNDEEELLGYVQGTNRWQDDDSLNLDQKQKLTWWWENEVLSEINSDFSTPQAYALLGVPLDHLYQQVARDVRAVADGKKHAVKRYIIANCVDSRYLGLHWVPVVYEIVPDDTEENAMAVASAVTSPLDPSQNDTASVSTRALRTPTEETRSPSIYTPASLFRASSTSLGLGSQPMVADMAQTFVAVSFLFRAVVAYASEMEARWELEYRRLVWRAQRNSEMYGLSPPPAPVPIAAWNRRETLIWGL